MGPVVGMTEIARVAIGRAAKMYDCAVAHGRTIRATHKEIDKFEESTAARATHNSPERRIAALREHVVRAMWRRV